MFNILEAAVVKTSLVQNKSLIASGTPSRGLIVFFAILLSLSSADLIAFLEFNEIYKYSFYDCENIL